MGVDNSDLNEFREVLENIQNDDFVRTHFGILADAFTLDIKNYFSKSVKLCWILNNCV